MMAQLHPDPRRVNLHSGAETKLRHVTTITEATYLDGTTVEYHSEVWK